MNNEDERSELTKELELEFIEKVLGVLEECGKKMDPLSLAMSILNLSLNVLYHCIPEESNADECLKELVKINKHQIKLRKKGENNE